MKALIDIGSNTVKLLIAELVNGKLSLKYENSWLCQLGKISDNKINDSSIVKFNTCINEIKQVLTKHTPRTTEIFATEALRKTKDPRAFEITKKCLNLDIKIFTDQQEAFYSSQAAFFKIKTKTPETQLEDNIYVDIGGSSTELSFYQDKDFKFKSIKAGVLSTYLKLNTKEIISDQEWNKYQEILSTQFDKKTFNSYPQNKNLVFNGGTLVIAAKILRANKDNEFYKLTKQELFELANNWRKISVQKRIELFKINEDRALIIPLGILIVISLMNSYGNNEIIVTPWGWRHGYLLEANLDLFDITPAT